MDAWDQIGTQISTTNGHPFKIKDTRPISGVVLIKPIVLVMAHNVTLLN